MSQVKIYGYAERLRPKQRALSEAIHACVMGVLGLPPGKRAHRFFHLEPEDFIAPDDRSLDYTILEIEMMSGRTKETKKQLIHALFERVEKEVGIKKQDLEICLIESPPENWGFRGMTGDEALASLSYSVKV